MRKVRRKTFEVLWSAQSGGSLRRIGKLTIQKQILADAKKLDSDFDQGTKLTKELEGLRSIHTAQDKFRIIYKVDETKELVHIVLVGKRRAGQQQDIYELARKLLRARLIKRDLR